MGKAQRDAHKTAVKALLEMAETFKTASKLPLSLEDKLVCQRARKDALTVLRGVRKLTFAYEDADAAMTAAQS